MVIMERKVLGMVVTLLVVLNLAAQEVQPLKLGDRLPNNLVVKHLVHYPTERVNLADIEGKAILLDFGATFCIPCLESLANLELLQKEFSDDLQVFMVTQESTDRVKDIQIPVIAQDTLLNSLFKHQALPHIVWIGKDRTIKALTDHQEVTKENVNALIRGEEMDLPVKWDFPYDAAKPMMVFNPENINRTMQPKMWQYRMVAGHMEGVQARQKTRVDSAAKQVWVSAVNIPLLKMYLTLYGYIWEHNFHPTQVVLHNIQDEQRFFYDERLGKKAAWQVNNTYCYEMAFPMALSREERNRRIIAQLNEFFDLKVSLRKRKRLCWVMTVADRATFRLHAFSAEISRYSVKGLLKRVNSIPGHVPLISELDEDEFQGKSVRLALGTGPLSDFEWLKKELEPQGIHLEVQVRDVETLWVEPAR